MPSERRGDDKDRKRSRRSRSRSRSKSRSRSVPRDRDRERERKKRHDKDPDNKRKEESSESSSAPSSHGASSTSSASASSSGTTPAEAAGAAEEKKRKRRRWDSSAPDEGAGAGMQVSAAIVLAQNSAPSAAGVPGQVPNFLLKAQAIAAATSVAIGIAPSLSSSASAAGPSPAGADAVSGLVDRAAAVQAALEKAKQAAKIQRQIQEKLLGMGLSGGPSAPASATASTATPQVVSAPAGMNADRFAAISGLPQQQKRPGEREWAPLILDKQGRQVDTSGKVLEVKRDVASFKVNRDDRIADAQVLPKPPVATSGKSEDPAFIHIDNNMHTKRIERERRGFRFVKPGKYVAKAQQLRMKQISREMRLNKFEVDVDVVRQPVKLDAIPEVEWWDADILKQPSYEHPINMEAITTYVHHPVELAPVAELPPPALINMMLTEKERKKIKRMKNIEKAKEIQDKIRLGLMAPPEPKMRLSNLMRVLGNEAITEPSRIEARVKKQMAARQKAHQLHNESRALTPEERKEKKRAKLQENTEVQSEVAVFRTGNLEDGQRRYKIDITAQQFCLTGCVVLHGNCNVVVAEGGPKGIKKFKRLMLTRIKWDEKGDAPKDQDEDEEPKQAEEEDDEEELDRKAKDFNKCVEVWEGVVAKRTFRNFRFEHCRSEAMARKFMKERGVEHYWDMARNYKDPIADIV